MYPLVSHSLIFSDKNMRRATTRKKLVDRLFCRKVGDFPHKSQPVSSLTSQKGIGTRDRKFLHISGRNLLTTGPPTHVGHSEQ
ncbi:hypothetical protein PoB_000614000 [Plakobranchus ocellatus]|uniref:Uncharacterized protein n=1 Tax=Plakobranchus ocellatus TaxID=259542 RepID=A0AAV3YA27_9GAST|nr:hypothetical protein PoB_000614000 [Plakobranchus ocellatus]